jgi:hypothetical protein
VMGFFSLIDGCSDHVSTINDAVVTIFIKPDVVFLLYCPDVSKFNHRIKVSQMFDEFI